MSATARWAGSPVNEPSAARVARALQLLDSVEVAQEDRDRSYIARHEAGHAVMSVELGVRVELVTIEATPAHGFDGHCHVALWPASVRAVQPHEIAALEYSIMILLAGEMAERLGAGSTVHAQHDRAMIEERLRCYPIELHDDERKALLAWCEVHTMRRLRRAWPAVIAIAMELVVARTITGDRVLTLYEATLGSPPPIPQPPGTC